MIAAVDVQYGETIAAAACVTFDAWPDASPSGELTVIVKGIEPHVPGELWRRELPCILAVLGTLDSPPELIIVDCYVWLDAHERPGLGAHLFEALQGRAPVIGVAKTAFRGSEHACAVRRGGSERPLYVTSRGISAADAARGIAAMDGEYRLPTLLKRVDRLCRDALAARVTHGSR